MLTNNQRAHICMLLRNAALQAVDVPEGVLHRTPEMRRVVRKLQLIPQLGSSSCRSVLLPGCCPRRAPVLLPAGHFVLHLLPDSTSLTCGEKNRPDLSFSKNSAPAFQNAHQMFGSLVFWGKELSFAKRSLFCRGDVLLPSGGVRKNNDSNKKRAVSLVGE